MNNILQDFEINGLVDVTQAISDLCSALRAEREQIIRAIAALERFDRPSTSKKKQRHTA